MKKKKRKTLLLLINYFYLFFNTKKKKIIIKIIKKMQNRLFPLPREFLEDSPKLDDGYPLSPLHSNATSEN